MNISQCFLLAFPCIAKLKILLRNNFSYKCRWLLSITYRAEACMTHVVQTFRETGFPDISRRHAATLRWRTRWFFVVLTWLRIVKIYTFEVYKTQHNAVIVRTVNLVWLPSNLGLRSILLNGNILLRWNVDASSVVYSKCRHRLGTVTWNTL